MSTVTKPIALDETLQSTNTALSSLGKDTTLQAIATAIANVGLSNIGNMSSLATTDKTSLVSAINEVVGDVSDLDTDKADKVASATNGNLAGLNASGNLTDSGVAASEIPALWKSQGEYGVKNLIPYPYYDVPKTATGINWGINNDGSITARGTTTANSWFRLTPYPISESDDIPSEWIGKEFTLSIDTINSTNIGARIDIYDDSSAQVAYVTASGSSKSGNITIPSTAKKMLIQTYVLNGVALLDTITLKPMLRLASDTDETYRPYAKTNKQLTDEVGKNTEDIDNLENRADNTTISISGNPISITGLKSNQLAVNPVITFEPIQAGSGDPSPSNVRAISGYDKIEVLSCGKNLLDYDKWKTVSLYSCTAVWSNYGVTLTATSSAGYTQPTYRVPVKQGDVIRITWNTDATSDVGRVYLFTNGSGAGTYANVTTKLLTYTVASGVTFITFRCDVYGSGVTVNYKNMMITVNTTDSTYEPYHKTTDLSEPLSQTAYGGSLDLRTGKLIVDREIVDMGDLEYTYNSSGAFFQNTSISRKYGANILCISSCYTDVGDKSAAEMSSLTTGKMASNNNNVAIKFKNTNYTDPSVFKTAMVGQKIVYPLATPIEIQLTPHEISLLKDYAYVSTNGTSMSFDYHNGEIATLGDVSQLGETVNELGDYLNDLLICKTKVFSNTGSVAAGNYKIMQEDISSNVPNGYKCIGALPLYSGDDGFVWVECVFVPSTNQVTVMIRNVGTSADSGTPQVGLLCIRV